MLSFKRSLYQLILRLHPAAFRDRFAREMSLDFEDALATYGFPRLLADATRSLVRQWATAPAFSPSHAQAPISLHPLLAGHYMVLEGDRLTPFELLRGSLLFAVFAVAIGAAFSSHSGHLLPVRDGGLGAGIGNPSQFASASYTAHHVAGPDYSQTLVIPTSSLSSQYSVTDRMGHTIYVNPAAQIIPQTESWKEFLARCALVTAIVWLTSLLVRRTRSVAARLAFVAAGLFVVAFAALMPLHLADTSTQTELNHSDKSRSHFESANIHLLQNAAAAHSEAAAPHATGTSANLVRVDSSIRILLAQVCNLSPGSIVGGPDWLDTGSYEITARIDPATSAAMQRLSPWLQQSQVRWMEQDLLVDRFHLKVHVESRQPDAPTPATTNAAPAGANQSVQVLVIDHIERPSEN